jgi:hypothetical protein
MSGLNRERMSVRYKLEAAQQLVVSFWEDKYSGSDVRTSFTYTVGWPTAGG